MCEKAARIAELEREIAELEAANEATPTWGWGAAVGARWERIKGLRAELAGLRNESPALTQGEGSEPVGAGSGEIVTWTVEQDEDSSVGATYICRKIGDRPEMQIARICGDSGEIEGYAEDLVEAANRASPPPLPVGNADPHDAWRESAELVARDNASLRKAGTALAEAALRVIREYDGTHRLALAVANWSTVVANENGRSALAQSNAQHDADPRVREALIAALVSETVSVWYDESVIFKQDRLRERFGKALVLASPQSQGLVEAADICRELYQANFPSASPSELHLLIEAERLIRARAADIMTAKPPKATR